MKNSSKCLCVLELVCVSFILLTQFCSSAKVGMDVDVSNVDVSWDEAEGLFMKFQKNQMDIEQLEIVMTERIKKNEGVNSMSCVVSYYNYKILESFFESMKGEKLELLNERTPIMILVSGRPLESLEELLKQLNSSYRISTTFIVLSHDHFNFSKVEAIQRISASLTNLNLVQIFFPYGEIVRSFGIRDNPLKGGRAVDSARFHWYFSFNQMFSSYSYISNFSPTATLPLFPRVTHVLFIEDDYWVLPDFYELALKLVPIYEQYCPHCLSINLGVHNTNHQRPLRDMITEWKRDDLDYSGIYARPVGFGQGLGEGLVISRRFWKEFETKQDIFCSTKSNRNWDLIVNFMQHHFDDSNFTNWQINPSKSRVHHTGKCAGMNAFKDKDRKCRPWEIKEWSVANQREQWKEELLPEYEKYRKDGMKKQPEGKEEWKVMKTVKIFKKFINTMWLDGNDILSQWCVNLPYIKMPLKKKNLIKKKRFTHKIFCK